MWSCGLSPLCFFFFFNDTATTEIYTLSLHDALPISPQLPGLLRALYRINAVRAGLYGAAASAYGDAFAQASRNATDTTARRLTGQLATAYSQGGAQLAGYSHQAASLASKRFKASLAVPGSVFMLTRAPEGNGNVLFQIDKDTGLPRSRVDLGKEREPVYAVDDVAGGALPPTAGGAAGGDRVSRPAGGRR